MSEAAPAVRRLRADDRPQWDVLWRGYQDFYRADVSPEVSDATFVRLCAGDGPLVGLVAVDADADDAPIGIAHLVFHPGTWSAGDHCYLEDLYVDPSHRGGAAARALFDAIGAEARARGAHRVYWHTQQYNGRARSLYDTVGTLTSFVVYERDLG